MGATEDIASLEERVATLERLFLKLALKLDEPTESMSSHLPPTRKLSVRDAVVEVLREGDRSMGVHEIKVRVERITGRQVSISTVRQRLASAAQAKQIKRTAKGVYSLV